jgi:hypothetical protein
MNTVQQTAQAFVTVYQALPEEVREQVKREILRQEKGEATNAVDDRIARYRTLEETMAPLRKALPADFKFNRDEANER